MIDRNFYKGKRILVTGHTGFKGSWLCKLLLHLGADVYGYSLYPKEFPNLFEISGLDKEMSSIIGDIRDYSRLKETFQNIQPEIVFHLAAQPIVRESYRIPRETYEINVMGTVNVCECIRTERCVKSFLNVTTDKVYENREWIWGYREEDRLNGFDPYSNSKSCSELVTHCFINSYFKDMKIAVSTARAGNVIGGGDFSKDRIIPDCIRAVQRRENIIVRNPDSVRPYQHVLEPLTAYLLIAQNQYEDMTYGDFYNVGPQDVDCIKTGELVELFCSKWGEGIKWESKVNTGPHEAGYLKLDCSKLRQKLNWQQTWGIEKAIEKTVTWTKQYLGKKNIPYCMEQQIEEFLKDEEK